MNFSNSLSKCVRLSPKRFFIFVFNPSVPYENNASERGVRKIKIKQKVGGCFRTDRDVYKRQEYTRKIS